MATFERSQALTTGGISKTAKFGSMSLRVSSQLPPAVVPGTLPSLPFSPTPQTPGPGFGGPGGTGGLPGGLPPLIPGTGPVGAIGSRIANAGGCELLPRALRGPCRVAFGVPTPSGGGTTIAPPGEMARCPAGTVRVPGTNTCVSPGDVFPGGDPFTFGAGGKPVVGAFGIPAITPLATQPTVLRCMKGAVLGADNLCYMRGSIPRAFRKHPPGARPPMTAGDLKALRRIGNLQRKAKRLASIAGLTTSKRGSGRRTTTKRKR